MESPEHCLDDGTKFVVNRMSVVNAGLIITKQASMRLDGPL